MSKNATPLGTFHTRGQLDDDVYKAVVVSNEYKVNESIANKVVLDIGANIGCFSLQALLFGAKKIYAFEPQGENFKMLQKNLGHLPNIELSDKAVWRSDREEPTVKFDNGMHEGAGHICSGKGGNSEVATVSLDSLISKIVAGGDRVGVLKIDCEGSEFPILYTSKMLSFVDEIQGELHFFYLLHENGIMLGLKDLPLATDGETFFAFLEREGFTVTRSMPLEVGISWGAMGFTAKRKIKDEN